MMRWFAAWLIATTTIWDALHLYATDSLPQPPVPQQLPMPPAGRQLSSVKGVSILRIEPNGPASPTRSKLRSFDIFGRGRFRATSAELEDVLLHAAPVDVDRVFVRAPLPAGLYDIDISTPKGGDEKMFDLLKVSLARSFGVHVRVDTYDEPIVTMRRTADWDKSPLNRVKATLFDKPIFAFSESSKAKATDNHGRLRFEGDMDFLAHSLDSYFGKPVVNRSGIEGRYAFDVQLRGASEAAALQMFLESHGIDFVAESRIKNGIYVESVR
jgi:uncharacterized protein (TIGR03435 family)